MRTNWKILLGTLVSCVGTVFAMWHVIAATECANPEFAATRAFAAPGGPFSVAVGDFNGDGNPDVVSAIYTSNIVAVALSNGDGTLRTNVHYTAQSFPNLVQVTDMNADGADDVFVGNALLGSSVLLGNGDGTLQANVNLTGIGNYALAVADLNGDGTNDVASAGFNSVTVHMGKGGLLFETNVYYTASVTAFISEAIGDVNADGIPDIVAGTDNVALGHLSVFLGNGDGTFLPSTNTIASKFNSGLVIADFTNDGTNDVAVLNSQAGAVAIFKSTGNGGLTILDSKLTGNTGPIVSAIRAVDLNDDGNMDVALGDYQAFVFLGNGDGTIQQGVRYEQSAIGLDHGDFNQDGIDDLVVTGGSLDGHPNVRLMLGNGDGSFQDAPHYATGRGPLFVQAGDFNGDGAPDLAVANAFTNNVSVLLNNGNGTFSAKQDYFTGTNPQSIALGDFNNDTRLDMIVANLNSPNVVMLAGNSNGTFQAAANAGTLLIGTWTVVAGKFNADNNLDFAVTGISASTFQSGIQVFRGNGNGTFQTPVTTDGILYGDQLVTGDFNKDAKLDLVWAKYGSNVVQAVLGAGNGTFGSTASYSVGTNAQSVAVADLNNDTRLDLVVANYGCSPCIDPNLNWRGSISVLLGNSNGTFQPAANTIVQTKGTLVNVKTGDFNGDGNVDVVVTDTSFGLGTVSVLLGNGNGTFQPPAVFSTQSTPASIVLADFNRDGAPDLAVANQASDSISILLNTCGTAAAGVTCSLSPDAATQNINTLHTVTVTVTSNSVPVSGATVNYEVTAGPNVGQIGADITDAQGHATFQYTGGATTGTDAISATGPGFACDATVEWIDSSLLTADLFVSKKAGKTKVVQNKKLVYTIAVTNSGPDMATGIVVTDTLPSNVAVVAGSTTPGYTLAGRTLEFDLGALGAGEGTNLVVAIKPKVTGKLINKVTVTANEPDPNTTNNFAKAKATVIP